MPRTKPSKQGLPMGKPLLKEEQSDTLELDSFLSSDLDLGQVYQTGQLQQGKRPITPKSAYLCWDADFRRKHVENDPWNSRGNAVISREAGKVWKGLSAEQRQPWEAASEKDQERYLAECAKAGVQPKVFAHMPGQVSRAARQRAGWHGQSRQADAARCPARTV